MKQNIRILDPLVTQGSPDDRWRPHHSASLRQALTGFEKGETPEIDRRS